MREDLLHYIWKFKKFNSGSLITIQGASLQIIDFGQHNKHSGPDFLNSRIEIDAQLWAGNVEIHINSSDWYAHGHHHDTAYRNVILHVVWNHDKTVFGPSGQPIATLKISEYTDMSLIENFEILFQKQKDRFINCEDYNHNIPIFPLLPWYEHLYRERLDIKASILKKLLQELNGDWERSFFIWMLQGFGQQVNKSSFLSLAHAIDFSIFKRITSDVHKLESMLFGLSGLLFNENCNDPYIESLEVTYRFIKRKHRLENTSVIRPEFMGVRPSNFPTIRLSQFAVLYATHRTLFSKMVESTSLNEIQDLLKVRATKYWDSHYTFGKPAKASDKLLSKTFRQSLIINSILPAKYLYAREHGDDFYPYVRNLMTQLNYENNGLIQSFKKMNYPVHHALDSQALLQLYNNYCTKNRCLECAIGNQILN